MKRTAQARPRKTAAPKLPPAPPFVPPYPPSWFDRIKPAVEAAPGPFWLPYLLLWLGLFALETLLHWLFRGIPLGSWRPIHTVVTAFVPGGLALMHALDRLARRSFDSFRPSLVPQVDPAELGYQLTVLPRRASTIISLASILLGGAVFLWAPMGQPAGGLLASFEAMQLSPHPAILAFNGLVLVATFATVGLVIYHTLRQLRLVSRIYTRWTHVDLLKPGPLYSLSRLTAGTAGGLIVVGYVNLVADRAFVHDSRNLVAAAVTGLLAVATFILPLWGVHRTLVAEKHRLLDHSAERLQSALAELHRRVDQAEFGQMDGLNKAIASLDLERSLLLRVPTWPWHPETLRTFVVALLLPLLLWIAQAVLGRLLPA